MNVRIVGRNDEIEALHIKLSSNPMPEEAPVTIASDRSFICLPPLCSMRRRVARTLRTCVQTQSKSAAIYIDWTAVYAVRAGRRMRLVRHAPREWNTGNNVRSTTTR